MQGWVRGQPCPAVPTWCPASGFRDGPGMPRARCHALSRCAGGHTWWDSAGPGLPSLRHPGHSPAMGDATRHPEARRGCGVPWSARAPRGAAAGSAPPSQQHRGVFVGLCSPVPGARVGARGCTDVGLLETRRVCALWVWSVMKHSRALFGHKQSTAVWQLW